MAECSVVRTNDGISWYCERQGSGPDIVLIPSGEGDCASFRTIASLLARSFTVTTFDMPGMSRAVAPRACYQDVTPQLLAGQIIGLMDELSIPGATLYGCNSGGAAVLALVANHPARVRSGIVHEVPFTVPPHMAAFTSLSDTEIVDACRNIFSTGMNEDEAAFRQLGSEYHARLDRNYITWVRNYFRVWPNLSEEGLTERPITWTIGALTPAGAFFENVKIACRCGIDIGLLPCMHFPQVSIPEKLALHIQEAAMKY